MFQDYTSYTEEDKKVWKTLFERQMSQLPAMASEEWIKALRIVNFSANKIPDFEEVNQILKNTTGWEVVVVPSIIPNKEFFNLLAEKKFPATTWLRKMSQLDYLEEPDMFHDVFGHIPLLSNPIFSKFFHEFGQLAIKFSGNEELTQQLGRFYWFTVEFGLIKEKDTAQIYGAGILSSFGESQFSLSEKPERLAFSVEEIINTSYDNSVIQQKYFVIENYKQLYDSLPMLEQMLTQYVSATSFRKDLIHGIV